MITFLLYFSLNFLAFACSPSCLIYSSCVLHARGKIIGKHRSEPVNSKFSGDIPLIYRGLAWFRAMFHNLAGKSACVAAFVKMANTYAVVVEYKCGPFGRKKALMNLEFELTIAELCRIMHQKLSTGNIDMENVNFEAVGSTSGNSTSSWVELDQNSIARNLVDFGFKFFKIKDDCEVPATVNTTCRHITDYVKCSSWNNKKL